MPTVAALAMEPMPKTMVQKMIGAIIILMSLMNPSPSGFSDLPTSGNSSPTTAPRMTAAMTAM